MAEVTSPEAEVLPHEPPLPGAGSRPASIKQDQPPSGKGSKRPSRAGSVDRKDSAPRSRQGSVRKEEQKQPSRTGSVREPVPPQEGKPAMRPASRAASVKDAAAAAGTPKAASKAASVKEAEATPAAASSKPQSRAASAANVADPPAPAAAASKPASRAVSAANVADPPAAAQSKPASRAGSAANVADPPAQAAVASKPASRAASAANVADQPAAAQSKPASRAASAANVADPPAAASSKPASRAASAANVADAPAAVASKPASRAASAANVGDQPAAASSKPASRAASAANVAEAPAPAAAASKPASRAASAANVADGAAPAPAAASSMPASRAASAANVAEPAAAAASKPASRAASAANVADAPAAVSSKPASRAGSAANVADAQTAATPKAASRAGSAANVADAPAPAAASKPASRAASSANVTDASASAPAAASSKQASRAASAANVAPEASHSEPQPQDRSKPSSRAGSAANVAAQPSSRPASVKGQEAEAPASSSRPASVKEKSPSRGEEAAPAASSRPVKDTPASKPASVKGEEQDAKQISSRPASVKEGEAPSASRPASVKEGKPASKPASVKETEGATTSRPASVKDEAGVAEKTASRPQSVKNAEGTTTAAAEPVKAPSKPNTNPPSRSYSRPSSRPKSRVMSSSNLRASITQAEVQAQEETAAAEDHAAPEGEIAAEGVSEAPAAAPAPVQRSDSKPLLKSKTGSKANLRSRAGSNASLVQAVLESNFKKAQKSQAPSKPVSRSGSAASLAKVEQPATSASKQASAQPSKHVSRSNSAGSVAKQAQEEPAAHPEAAVKEESIAGAPSEGIAAFPPQPVEVKEEERNSAEEKKEEERIESTAEGESGKVEEIGHDSAHPLKDAASKNSSAAADADPSLQQLRGSPGQNSSAADDSGTPKSVEVAEIKDVENVRDSGVERQMASAENVEDSGFQRPVAMESGNVEGKPVDDKVEHGLEGTVSASREIDAELNADILPSGAQTEPTPSTDAAHEKKGSEHADAEAEPYYSNDKIHADAGSIIDAKSIAEDGGARDAAPEGAVPHQEDHHAEAPTHSAGDTITDGHGAAAPDEPTNFADEFEPYMSNDKIHADAASVAEPTEQHQHSEKLAKVGGDVEEAKKDVVEDDHHADARDAAHVEADGGAKTEEPSAETTENAVPAADHSADTPAEETNVETSAEVTAVPENTDTDIGAGVEVVDQTSSNEVGNDATAEHSEAQAEAEHKNLESVDVAETKTEREGEDVQNRDVDRHVEPSAMGGDSTGEEGGAVHTTEGNVERTEDHADVTEVVDRSLGTHGDNSTEPAAAEQPSEERSLTREATAYGAIFGSGILADGPKELDASEATAEAVASEAHVAETSQTRQSVADMAPQSNLSREASKLGSVFGSGVLHTRNDAEAASEKVAVASEAHVAETSQTRQSVADMAPQSNLSREASKLGSAFGSGVLHTRNDAEAASEKVAEPVDGSGETERSLTREATAYGAVFGSAAALAEASQTETQPGVEHVDDKNVDAEDGGQREETPPRSELSREASKLGSAFGSGVLATRNESQKAEVEGAQHAEAAHGEGDETQNYEDASFENLESTAEKSTPPHSLSHADSGEPQDHVEHTNAEEMPQSSLSREASKLGSAFGSGVLHTRNDVETAPEKAAEPADGNGESVRSLTREATAYGAVFGSGVLADASQTENQSGGNHVDDEKHADSEDGGQREEAPPAADLTGEDANAYEEASFEKLDHADESGAAAHDENNENAHPVEEEGRALTGETTESGAAAESGAVDISHSENETGENPAGHHTSQPLEVDGEAAAHEAAHGSGVLAGTTQEAANLDESNHIANGEMPENDANHASNESPVENSEAGNNVISKSNPYSDSVDAAHAGDENVHYSSDFDAPEDKDASAEEKDASAELRQILEDVIPSGEEVVAAKEDSSSPPVDSSNTNVDVDNVDKVDNLESSNVDVDNVDKADNMERVDNVGHDADVDVDKQERIMSKTEANASSGRVDDLDEAQNLLDSLGEPEKKGVESGEPKSSELHYSDDFELAHSSGEHLDASKKASGSDEPDGSANVVTGSGTVDPQDGVAVGKSQEQLAETGVTHAEQTEEAREKAVEPAGIPLDLLLQSQELMTELVEEPAPPRARASVSFRDFGSNRAHSANSKAHDPVAAMTQPSDIDTGLEPSRHVPNLSGLQELLALVDPPEQAENAGPSKEDIASSEAAEQKIGGETAAGSADVSEAKDRSLSAHEPASAAEEATPAAHSDEEAAYLQDSFSATDIADAKERTLSANEPATGAEDPAPASHSDEEAAYLQDSFSATDIADAKERSLSANEPATGAEDPAPASHSDEEAAYLQDSFSATDIADAKERSLSANEPTTGAEDPAPASHTDEVAAYLKDSFSADLNASSNPLDHPSAAEEADHLNPTFSQDVFHSQAIARQQSAAFSEDQTEAINQLREVLKATVEPPPDDEPNGPETWAKDLVESYDDEFEAFDEANGHVDAAVEGDVGTEEMSDAVPLEYREQPTWQTGETPEGVSKMVSLLAQAEIMAAQQELTGDVRDPEEMETLDETDQSVEPMETRNVEKGSGDVENVQLDHSDEPKKAEDIVDKTEDVETSPVEQTVENDTGAGIGEKQQSISLKNVDNVGVAEKSGDERTKNASQSGDDSAEPNLADTDIPLEYQDQPLWQHGETPPGVSKMASNLAHEEIVQAETELKEEAAQEAYLDDGFEEAETSTPHDEAHEAAATHDESDQLHADQQPLWLNGQTPQGVSELVLSLTEEQLEQAQQEIQHEGESTAEQPESKNEYDMADFDDLEGILDSAKAEAAYGDDFEPIADEAGSGEQNVENVEATDVENAEKNVDGKAEELKPEEKNVEHALESTGAKSTEKIVDGAVESAEVETRGVDEPLNDGDVKSRSLNGSPEHKDAPAKASNDFNMDDFDNLDDLIASSGQQAAPEPTEPHYADDFDSPTAPAAAADEEPQQGGGAWANAGQWHMDEPAAPQQEQTEEASHGEKKVEELTIDEIIAAALAPKPQLTLDEIIAQAMKDSAPAKEDGARTSPPPAEKSPSPAPQPSKVRSQHSLRASAVDVAPKPAEKKEEPAAKPAKAAAPEKRKELPPPRAPKKAPEPVEYDSKKDINYVALVASLRREITSLRSEIGIRDDALEEIQNHEQELRDYVEISKHLAKDAIDKNTRILLDRQKKAYQILVAKLRREIRRLKFQRNSLADPLIEAKYFPYLPRTPFGTAARKPPLGIIGNLPSRSSDYFALNPPPPTGNHPESGNRWWWGSGPDLSSHLPPPPRPQTEPVSSARKNRPLRPSQSHPEPTSNYQPQPPTQAAGSGGRNTPPTLPAKLEPLNHPQQPDSKLADTHANGPLRREPRVGDRACVMINEERCLGMVKYVGIFDPYPETGLWCGIKLDRPLGKHDGVVKGKRYFTCEENHGLFVKIDKIIPIFHAGGKRTSTIKHDPQQTYASQIPA
ncbi:hypothetical protein HDU96_004323 [Phlyctochytrium bullatum]|nr:hypothetical protein HDU96_004323 [Phlyctochytrium bullatum]